ncbi:MAG: hypothetical protein R3B40_32120 [Polyangiales bacterium]|nr:hypothetical protein [Myxococcales bacterium]MCB9661515.1 hypothetical protein [Sandaracinaceae bacterium]
MGVLVAPALLAAVFSSAQSVLAWGVASLPFVLLAGVSFASRHQVWAQMMERAQSRPGLAVVTAATLNAERGLELNLRFSGIDGEERPCSVRTSSPLDGGDYVDQLVGSLVPVHVRPKDVLHRYFVDWNHWHRCGGIGGWITPPPTPHEAALAAPHPRDDRRAGVAPPRARARRLAFVVAFAGLVALATKQVGTGRVAGVHGVALDALLMAALPYVVVGVSSFLLTLVTGKFTPSFQKLSALDMAGEARVVALRHGDFNARRFVEARLALRVNDQELVTQVFNSLPPTVPLRDLVGLDVPVRYASKDPRCAHIDWEALDARLGPDPPPRPPGGADAPDTS